MKYCLPIAIFSVVLTIISVITLHAQTITSITVEPSNPSSTDIISVLVNCEFPNGSCNPYTKSAFVSGENIYSTALHCVGMLTVICDYTDTFEIGTLPSGNYAFYFSLNAGAAPAPCTAGIIPFDKDTLLFEVSTATGVGKFQNGPGFLLRPSLTSGSFEVSVEENINAHPPHQLHIVSSCGREIEQVTINGSHASISSNLPAGIYFCFLTYQDYRSPMQKLVITGR